MTFNAAAVYLDRSAVNDRIIQTLLPMRRLQDPDLANGVVAIHYRARPETDPGVPFVRSFIGLALFTPEFRELYRYNEPVIYPDPMDDGDDVLGVEDPRITRIGDTFYMIYCGLRKDPETIYFTQLCSARSKDLLHWEKLGPMNGDINKHRNKDGVLLPGQVRRQVLAPAPSVVGRAWRTRTMRCTSRSAKHRTEYGGTSDRSCGPLRTRDSKNPGSVRVPFPLLLGDGRYLMIYHTGNSKPDGTMEYDLDAALLDLRRAGTDPAGVVHGRIEHFMVPETPEELASQSSLQVQNVLFACGSYEYGEHLYIIYGGADTYLLAARVHTAELRQGTGRPPVMKNPFLA